MATGGSVATKEGLRYAEYLPPSTQRPNADIDHDAELSSLKEDPVELYPSFASHIGKKADSSGLGVAAVAFAGRYTFQIWKPLQQVITETARKILSPSLSSYYKGGFEPKMSRREASLILDVSQSASKAKIQAAFNKMMRLNHPDRGGSGYLAGKIIEAKNLLLSYTKLK